MSLTTDLRQPRVRERFREEFPTLPKLTANKPMLAPPLSNRYALIGTAFDYLLRFYLQRRNPKAKHRRWVAEAGLSKLAGPMMSYVDIETEEVTFAPDTKEFKAGKAVLDKARTAHAYYIANGKTTDALLEGVIALAKLDGVYRRGYIDDNLCAAHRADIEDLRKLISVVNPRRFLSKKHCILNPTFGTASRSVGGADADLIIDGTLIEIKVVQTLEINRDNFNQLIGYFALTEMNRLRGAPCAPRITKIGIYFARHAHLEVWDMKSLIDPESFPGFLRWFSDTAGLRSPAIRARKPNRKMPASTRHAITSQSPVW